VLRQFCQALVGLDTRLIDRRRTGGDENRIELVVLGTAQMEARIGFVRFGCPPCGRAKR
jgi:hypothetical protein